MSGKTFKDYYQDPEFRARHKAYMTTKIKCECGCLRTRNNMTRHKETEKHKKMMEQKQRASGLELEDLQKEIKRLNKRIAQLEK